MKCTAKRESLIGPIAQVERSVGKNLTVPVLACVLMRVEGNTLTLTATNLEVGVRYSVPVSGGVDGTVAVPAGVFSHVLSSLPSGAEVALEVVEQVLVVQGGGGSSRITVQDAEEFPSLPVVDEGVDVTLPQKALVSALSSVAYCASTSTVKPELASVFVHPAGNELVCAATDSFRLAEKKVPLKQSVEADPFLIPARSVHDMVRVLTDDDKPVTLRVGEHQLSLTIGGVYMTLRLTQGTFPDYTQIIPKEFVAEATLLVADFERVLKKASVFSDKFQQILLTVEPEEGVFTVHTENSAVGESTDTVPAALEGESLAVRFNQRYLNDAFHTIHTDSFVFKWSGGSTPAVMRPVGDDSVVYLVMPMNR